MLASVDTFAQHLAAFLLPQFDPNPTILARLLERTFILVWILHNSSSVIFLSRAVCCVPCLSKLSMDETSEPVALV